jgi:hypothetical protein
MTATEERIVDVYAVKPGAPGGNSVITLLGTTGDPSHFEPPSLSQPSTDAVTLNDEPASFYLNFANTTNRLGVWSITVPNPTNAVNNIYPSGPVQYATTITALQMWCDGAAAQVDLYAQNETNAPLNFGTKIYTNFTGAANAYSNIAVSLSVPVDNRLLVVCTNPATGITNMQFAAKHNY